MSVTPPPPSNAPPALLAPRTPPAREGIEIRLADARDVDWPIADLVLTDPPWTYTQRTGESTADDHYTGLPAQEIAYILGSMRAPRLAMWATWPLLGEWWQACATVRGSWPWEPGRLTDAGELHRRARLHGLGNAVVPHVGYVLGLRVLQRLGLPYRTTR